MASYTMSALPDLETGTTLEQVNRNLKTVKNWLYQLNEQLKYNLYNLETENMTEETVDKFTSVSDDVKAELSVLDGKITAAVSASDGRFAALEVSIDGITAQVQDAEGNISQLQQTATSLTSTIQDVEGNVSVLQQTAAGLTSSVSNLQGDLSEISQSVDSIYLGVSNGSESSTITLYKDGIAMSSQSIRITGMVTFSDLSGNGTTTINGANITTGTISADRIAAISSIRVGSTYVQCSSSGVDIYSSNGNITLGSPSGWLQMNGTCYLYGSPNAIVAEGNIVADSYQLHMYSGVFDGWCYAPDWTMGSDRKLKKDIQPLDIGVYKDLIMGLSPVQYRYISDRTGKLRFGFIAQDVVDDLANVGLSDSGALVTAARPNPDDQEDTLTLSYNDIIAPLVLVVQAQQSEIDTLKEAVGIGKTG